ncbi:MAG: ATP-dependent RNA helicase DbpA, partial [Proteobacteria bacterium]|nr:ATP-dependent RNA helicase DbpA [Pseudomonadota bacterium]
MTATTLPLSPPDAQLNSADARPFDDLPLTAAMLAAVKQLGYLTMTPIQAASLPLALAGRDLIARAKT